jgi:four helix bundle protein
MQDFKKLQVWQKAHSLTLGVDRASKRIRGSQYASLRNQIFRAAASIPANIAEGRRQKSQKDFGRFLSIALNSSSELEYHLILARDTNNMPEKEFLSLVGQTITVRKMLYALIKRVAEVEASPETGDAPHQSPKPPTAPPKAATQTRSRRPLRPKPQAGSSSVSVKERPLHS